MKKTKNDGYLVFRRKQVMKKTEDRVIGYWDKIIGFCNTEKTAISLARSAMEKDYNKYNGLKGYKVLEVTDDEITGYKFDNCGELDVYTKDKLYPFLIKKLSNTSEENFIIYIVSIEHYI